MAGAPQDFGEWLRGAKAGSGEALGQVLETCRRYLLLIAERELDPALRAKGGASDLVQQTFMEAHRDFARFQGTSDDELRAWLRCMLLHNVGKFVRQYHTQKRGAGREVSIVPDSSSAGLQAFLTAATPSPSVKAMRREEDQALHDALDRLPNDYRQVIVLRYEEERPFEEIGVVMGRSAEAVRKLWARAVERLQQELETPP
jgi:RNA polymerase sigma-70 factor (ECF subfamily)